MIAGRYLVRCAVRKFPVAASCSSAEHVLMMGCAEVAVTPADLSLTPQRRFFGSKRSKLGHHMERLDEEAHRFEREEAVEKRKKKKAGKKKNRQAAKGTDVEVPEVEFTDDLADDDEDDGPSLPDPKDLELIMNRIVDGVKESYKSIRGAEPTPDIFDRIMVEAYGDTVPLPTVAQAVIVSPTLAQVTCYDPSVTKSVRDAIRDTLELNPQLEDEMSGTIKVPLPRVSMETRQKTAKQLAKQAERARNRIRDIRRKAMNKVKQAKDGKLEGVSEDEAFRTGKEIDSATEKVTKKLNDQLQAKQDEILAV